MVRVIKASYEIIAVPDGMETLKFIELIGRTCYKSEEKITKNSALNFVKLLVDSGHHSVIEHSIITVRFICDRGISHELVRHRLASYSQESTRYANYSKDKFRNGITVIKPLFWAEGSAEYSKWLKAMEEAEKSYMELIHFGSRPEEARSVLPNSLKTEIVMTCNIREWRHVLKLRCSRLAHPQMREIMLPLLEELHKKIPVLFDDLYEEYREDIRREGT
jgi:thymidylate synthase (FAD)